ncbi:MAG: hypothetical protein NZ578_05610 [Candidatus Binatia bacterium]|nr:hypothetical protein [Candidatus Binatia bacterium]
MQGHRYSFSVLLTLVLLGVVSVAVAQVRSVPDFAPPQRPLIKLIGFLDPDPPPHTTDTVLTLALPGEAGHRTFLLKQMLVMAGPLRTPGAILDEVRPYATNFYIRAPANLVEQIKHSSPATPIAILAEYTRADRSLMVVGIEALEEQQGAAEQGYRSARFRTLLSEEAL